MSSSVGLRNVINPIDPFSPFKSAPGFFNIAHRGASYYAPENTMASFQLALEMNADMIELDVTLSRDNIPVVFHDRTLSRTTGGKGNIRKYLLRELHELDAGSWFSESHKNLRIPTLEEVLIWSSGKIALNIEIKKEAVDGNHTFGIVELISKMVSDFKMTDQVVISSFSKEALARSRNVAPGISTAHLVNPYSWGTTRALHLMKRLGATGLNIKPRQMKPKLMDMAILENIPVWVYTVDDEDEMKTVIKKGATGIFTNKPDRLAEVAAITLGGHAD